MQRRTFLSSLVAAAPLSALEPLHPSAPLKLGINSYCLRAYRWSDAQFIDFAVQHRLDALFLQDSTDPEAADLAHWKTVGEQARRLGLAVQTGVGAVLPRSPEAFEASRQQLLTGIARAQAFGSPVVRCLHAGDRAHLPPGTIDQHRETMVRLLRSVRTQVTDAGVKIAIENHKDLQAWEMRQVIEAAGPEFVGSYLDTGNPVFVAESPEQTVDVLAPYALCLHLRDSVVYPHAEGAMVQWVPLGAGVVNFAAILERIAAIKPDICVFHKPITGRPPALIPFLRADFWQAYPSARAADLARFVQLGRGGHPFEKAMVIEDLGGKPSQPAYAEALKQQQMDDIIGGLDYARNVLNLGRRSRT